MKLKGQSMFELLVAVSITSLILVGIMSLASTSVRNSTTSTDNSAASRYAQEAIEFIRSERDNSSDWLTFVTERSSDAGKKYCFDSSPPNWSNSGSCGETDVISGTLYKRGVVLTTEKGIEDGDKVDVKVTVSWETPQGPNYATISSTLTDWRK